MKRTALAIASLLLAAVASGLSTAQELVDPALTELDRCIASASAPPPDHQSLFQALNPATNDPDRVSWCLFAYVVSDANHSGRGLFETWANDAQTFTKNPTFPIDGDVKQLRSSIEMRILHERNNASGRLLGPLNTPSDTGGPQNREETRRNKVSFDFIVQNNLYTITGLRQAFADYARRKSVITFPADSVEVKADWYPVSDSADPARSGIPGYAGTIEDTASTYHVSRAADGRDYALVALHVISKLVPNWTWATFEHVNNPGRCEYIGCKDSFGSIPANIPPQTEIPDLNDPSFENQANNPEPYAPCVKTPALLAVFAASKADPVYENYCLKGSQTDFSDATGRPSRLGNSVTEQSFDFQSSCMSCHARASFGSDGTSNTLGGFDRVGGAPLGPVHGEWYWTTPLGGPWSPAALPMGLPQIPSALSTDFVWSIAFCAIDDTVSPSASSPCAEN